MISKRIISEIRELHNDKNRKEQQLFIAEGEKVVDEILRSAIKIRLIAATDSWTKPPGFDNNETEFYTVSETELSKISLLKNPNKVLAVAETPTQQPLNFAYKKELILVLDGIRDPGNLGTLIRTADWFGVTHIFCSNDCVDGYNPKVVQSAMGSLFRMQVHYGDLALIIESAKSFGYRIISASGDGTSYKQLDTAGPTMLVIGSESHGISQTILNLTDMKAAIPRASQSQAESLNAGVAGAILLSYFKQA